MEDKRSDAAKKYDQLLFDLFKLAFPEYPFALRLEGDESSGGAQSRQPQPVNNNKFTYDAKLVPKKEFTGDAIEFTVDDRNSILNMNSGATLHSAKANYYTSSQLCKNGCVVATPPDNTVENVVLEKLLVGSDPLVRYVGSYYAAILESILDKMFSKALPIRLKLQQGVLNQQWRCTDGSGKEFITELLTRLMNCVVSCIPDGVNLNGQSQAQINDTGRYMDFVFRPTETTITKDVPADNTTTITQTITFYTGLEVDFKVSKSAGHLEREHTAAGIAGVPVEPLPFHVASSFCLSHSNKDDTTSAATTFAVKRYPGNTLFGEVIGGQLVPRHLVKSVKSDPSVTLLKDGIIQIGDITIPQAQAEGLLVPLP